MTQTPSPSMFTSARQHFDNPRFKETPLLTISTDPDETEPLRLTADQAYQALYGPEAEPRLSAAIWKTVLSAARADVTPHGTGKLLALRLAVPRMAGTVHRICRRLGADRLDVEAEMTLILLEGLVDPDTTAPDDITPLLKAARAGAWQSARSRLKELPSARVERIAEDQALGWTGEVPDTSTREPKVEVCVDRPDGPDGLHAPLRFRVPAEHLPAVAFAETEGSAVLPPISRCRRRRRSRHRVGTLPIRPAARPA